MAATTDWTWRAQREELSPGYTRIAGYDVIVAGEVFGEVWQTDEPGHGKWVATRRQRFATPEEAYAAPRHRAVYGDTRRAVTKRLVRGDTLVA